MTVLHAIRWLGIAWEDICEELLQAKCNKMTNGTKKRPYLKWFVLIHWILRISSVDEMDNVDAALIIHNEMSTAAYDIF
jgi:hypothetical protein